MNCAQSARTIEQHCSNVTNSVTSEETKEAYELFGEDVGLCHGTFACSHNRIMGRLYVTTRAILFHSTLLGFERRIYLLNQDILEIKLFRTTSISIKTTECEVYVLKSFVERDVVLLLLHTLLPSAISERTLFQGRLRQDNSSPTTPPRGQAPHELPRNAAEGVQRQISHVRSNSSTDTATILTSNRRRSVSDSIMAQPEQGPQHLNRDDINDLPEDNSNSHESAPGSETEDGSTSSWTVMRSRDPLPDVVVEVRWSPLVRVVGNHIPQLTLLFHAVVGPSMFYQSILSNLPGSGSPELSRMVPARLHWRCRCKRYKLDNLSE